MNDATAIVTAIACGLATLTALILGICYLAAALSAHTDGWSDGDRHDVGNYRTGLLDWCYRLGREQRRRQDARREERRRTDRASS